MSDRQMTTSDQATSIIFPTEIKKEVGLSPSNAKKATEIYYHCCKRIAQYISSNSDKFGEVEYDNLIELVPDPEFKIKSAKPKKDKILLKDWNKTDTMEQLMTLSVDNLKTILSENSLSLSGNKKQLSNRVLSINYPNIAESDVKPKKKGRPKKNIKIVSEIEKQETLEELLNNCDDIYVDSAGIISDTPVSSSIKHIFVKSKNWVFKDLGDEYEFIGIISKGKMINMDPSQELLAMFEMGS